jgi:hypothetical protein
MSHHDEHNERLVSTEFLDAFNAWLDAPSGDKATSDRLVKALVAQGVRIGRATTHSNGHNRSRYGKGSNDRETLGPRAWG